MDKDVQLGPITTKKRLEAIEKLVEEKKKKAQRFCVEVKDLQGLIKVIL